MVLSRGEGAYVWDADGKRYLDLCAGFGALALGHRHHTATDALANAKIIHGMGDVFASESKVELVEAIRRICPPHLQAVALSITGGQAVEFAMKTAMRATKRFGFIALRGGYHGLDLGVLPATWRPDFREPFLPWMHHDYVVHVSPDADREELLGALATLRSRGVDLAGMIVEPVMGRMGVIPLSEATLMRFAQFSHENSALLIFDEVLTGLGRAGRWTFAESVPADIVCFGKILGGGLPLSACVATSEVMRSWPESQGEAMHTGTFFGHPLACSLGLATLCFLEERQFPERAREMGRRAIDYLHASLHGCQQVREIRGMGMMLAIELIQPAIGVKLMETLLADGVIILPSGAEGSCVSLTPPLNIAWEDFETGLVQICSAIRRLA